MHGFVKSEIFSVFKLLEIVHDLVCSFCHTFDLPHNFLTTGLPVVVLKWKVLKLQVEINLRSKLSSPKHLQVSFRLVMAAIVDIGVGLCPTINDALDVA